MSKPTHDIYVSRPASSDRRLLREWVRQPDIRRGDSRVVLNRDGLKRTEYCGKLKSRLDGAVVCSVVLCGSF